MTERDEALAHRVEMLEGVLGDIADLAESMTDDCNAHQAAVWNQITEQVRLAVRC